MKEEVEKMDETSSEQTAGAAESEPAAAEEKDTGVLCYYILSCVIIYYHVLLYTNYYHLLIYTIICYYVLSCQVAVLVFLATESEKAAEGDSKPSADSKETEAKTEEKKEEPEQVGCSFIFPNPAL